MDSIDFGLIGVDVENYTPEGIHDLFVENGLDKFISTDIFLRIGRELAYKESKYLQTESRGKIDDFTAVYVLSGYISYTTDMDTYLLILRTALLDIDLANELINDLYYQGLIKPRNSKWDISNLLQ